MYEFTEERLGEEVRIRIISPSDSAPVKERRHFWGDHWVKVDLENEFRNRGYEVVQDGKPDIDFFLFGAFNWGTRPTADRRFCWLYSHPDIVINKRDIWMGFASQFEHIFVLSNSFVSEVKKDFSNCSVLLGGSSKEYKPRRVEAEYDIVFVGNAGKPQRVEVMRWLISLNKYKICIAGGGWERKLIGEIRLGQVDWVEYFDNRKLGDFFNKGKLTFYQTHEDMRKNGFVAVRILDVFASSDCLCISDVNSGLDDIFSDIPTFETKEDLEEHFDWYLGNPRGLEEDALVCRRDVRYFTFKNVVDEIEKVIRRQR